MEYTKDMARALRRHHAARLKKARKRHWGRIFDAQAHDLTPRQLGMLVATPAPCSCWMCGNPRTKLGELKIQERRLFQDLLQAE
jgi:hypothetical protein